jgi:putative addiction module component (TIGR02574 family)
MTKTQYPELLRMSTPDKLRLIEDLWNSIAAEPDQVPVPDELKEELDRRHEEFVRDPNSAVSWEEAKERIRRGEVE